MRTVKATLCTIWDCPVCGAENTIEGNGDRLEDECEDCGAEVVLELQASPITDVGEDD